MARSEKVLLDVRNLKQHFKSGRGKNKMVVKAVDGISFQIHEVKYSDLLENQDAVKQLLVEVLSAYMIQQMVMFYSVDNASVVELKHSN